MELSNTPRAASAGAGGLDDQVYQRLLKERIIFLGSVVEDSMANAICAQMLLLAAEDPEKDIYLYINSPGGSISAGMAIYDTMQYIKNDVATVAMGLAASMGQIPTLLRYCWKKICIATCSHHDAPTIRWNWRNCI